MKRIAFSALAMATAPASAAEFGILRGLQHGPIGDSPQFVEMEKYEAEAAVSLARSFGKITRNGDPDNKVDGSSIDTRVAVGGGMMPTKTFGLSVYIDFQLAADADEEQTRATPTTTLDTGHYEHELALFGFFKSQPLVIGGGLGLKLIGNETREFEFNKSDKYTSEIGTAAMPMLRLFGGISTKQFDGTIGARVFAKGDATAEVDADHTKVQYDLIRRNPGEIHVDAKIKFAQAAIAGSIAYVLTGQASEQVDEFSTAYVTQGSSRRRFTGDARRNTDHVRVGVGGRFDPTKMIGILGGLTYTAASYAEEQYASLEHENLGGIRLLLGTEVHVQKFRGFFNASYQPDSTASYTQKDGSKDVASQPQMERTQRAPIAANDQVKVTQGSWSLALGGGISI